MYSFARFTYFCRLAHKRSIDMSSWLESNARNDRNEDKIKQHEQEEKPWNMNHQLTAIGEKRKAY